MVGVPLMMIVGEDRRPGRSARFGVDEMELAVAGPEDHLGDLSVAPR